jgi:hypothetical protein
MIRENVRRLSARPYHVASAYDKDNAEWILSELKRLPWRVVDKLDQPQPTHWLLKGFRMSEWSLAFASLPPLSPDLEDLQESVDRTHGRIMIGEMLTVSRVTAGCGR